MKAQLTVGAGANAQVVAKLPIVEVMLGAMPRASIGRYFVMRQTERSTALKHQVLHLRNAVVVGQSGRKFSEVGVWLQRQVVVRQVRWAD